MALSAYAGFVITPTASFSAPDGYRACQVGSLGAWIRNDGLAVVDFSSWGPGTPERDDDPGARSLEDIYLQRSVVMNTLSFALCLARAATVVAAASSGM